MIETITVIVCIGLGIAIGMYLTSQSENNIERNLENFNKNWSEKDNKELLDRLKHYDDTYNNGNFTYYYTHKKRKKDDN